MKAVDGDRGIGNPITYSITGGPDHLFAVNKLNGLVYVNVRLVLLYRLLLAWQWILCENPTLIITKCAKAPIDRESEDARNGAFILEVTTHYQHNSIIADSASASAPLKYELDNHQGDWNRGAWRGEEGRVHHH